MAFIDYYKILEIDKKATEAEIKKSWESALSDFKTIRKKYLLYKDFK